MRPGPGVARFPILFRGVPRWQSVFVLQFCCEQFKRHAAPSVRTPKAEVSAHTGIDGIASHGLESRYPAFRPCRWMPHDWTEKAAMMESTSAAKQHGSTVRIRKPLFQDTCKTQQKLRLYTLVESRTKTTDGKQIKLKMLSSIPFVHLLKLEIRYQRTIGRRSIYEEKADT